MLYLVATPIGNLGDMSARAIQVLNEVDLIASEDTRKTGRLLQRFQINTPQVPFHEYNEQAAGDRIIEQMRRGCSVAVVTDAGTPGIADPGYSLVRQAIDEGLIDALASDHAPHLQSEKELEFLAAPFGIASLECALALYIKALIEPGILDWPGLIRMMTVNPARIIGIEKGSLSRGKQGDVTIIDPEAEWTVDVNQFLSKSRNCPYHGWKVKGKVEKTIVGGEIRFEL